MYQQLNPSLPYVGLDGAMRCDMHIRACENVHMSSYYYGSGWYLPNSFKDFVRVLKYVLHVSTTMSCGCPEVALKNASRPTRFLIVGVLWLVLVTGGIFSHGPSPLTSYDLMKAYLVRISNMPKDSLRALVPNLTVKHDHRWYCRTVFCLKIIFVQWAFELVISYFSLTV